MTKRLTDEEIETRIVEGIQKLKIGIDELLTFMSSNKSAAENPARQKKLESDLNMLERAFVELRKMRKKKTLN
jgi:hypothetical protein